MIQLKSELSIQMSGNQTYLGVAYDGEKLYFTARDRHISVIDESGAFEGNTYTRRMYNALCYDAGRGCFWAVSPSNYGTIFQLSKEFQERNYMRFRIRNARLGQIQNICYDASVNQFILLIASTIYVANFDGMCQPMEVDEQLQGTCMVCGCAGRYLFCIVQKEERYELLVVIRASGEVAEEMELPENCQPLSITACESEQEQTFKIKIYSSDASDSDSVMEYEYRSTKEVQEPTQAMEEKEEETSRELEKVYEDILSDLLGHQTIESNCECCMPQCPPSPPSCCSNCCHEVCDDKNCEHICLEILESIACIETSIACVLNAEGQKLQKALKCTNSITELLKINESIQKTIIHSTHLEQLLYAKLELVFEKCLNK